MPRGSQSQSDSLLESSQNKASRELKLHLQSQHIVHGTAAIVIVVTLGCHSWQEMGDIHVLHLGIHIDLLIEWCQYLQRIAKWP